MSRYDGLIIPRSYSEYLNKTDSATLSQMLQQLTGLWSHAVSAGDNKPVTSDAVNDALANYINKTNAATLKQALQLPGVLSEAVAAGDNKAVKSSAVNNALTDYDTSTEVTEKISNALAEYKYYSIKADLAPNLASLVWYSYYAQLPIPNDVNEILMCSIYGFSLTNNGVRYQIAIGQDKKSLYVAKVNQKDTINNDERIGYAILYR